MQYGLIHSMQTDILVVFEDLETSIFVILFLTFLIINLSYEINLEHNVLNVFFVDATM